MKSKRPRDHQVVLGGAVEQIDGCRRIVLLQLDRGPDGGNEVTLHDRVQGPFRTDFVCEFTGFLCSFLTARARAPGQSCYYSLACFELPRFIASSLHVLSGFGILQGR